MGKTYGQSQHVGSHDRQPPTWDSQRAPEHPHHAPEVLAGAIMAVQPEAARAVRCVPHREVAHWAASELGCGVRVEPQQRKQHLRVTVRHSLAVLVAVHASRQVGPSRVQREWQAS
jgi:hypothetical protein